MIKLNCALRNDELGEEDEIIKHSIWIDPDSIQVLVPVINKNLLSKGCKTIVNDRYVVTEDMIDVIRLIENCSYKKQHLTGFEEMLNRMDK